MWAIMKFLSILAIYTIKYDKNSAGFSSMKFPEVDLLRIDE